MFELKLENESGNVVNINDGKSYVVVSCSGLNPPSASIFTAKSPNRKGSKYNGSTLNERNIVVEIKLLGDIETNRNALYEWCETEQYVKVLYKNGMRDVFCEGHISDCDIDLFTDSETVNLAIICENPYWRALEEISVDITSILNQFTFSFAIDSEGIPFSTINSTNITGVYNSGAETGTKIIVFCKDEVKNFRIYDAKSGGRSFGINYTFPKGWYFVIDTESSPKTCKAYPPDNVSPINLMPYIAENPTWFKLKKGANSFGYSVDGNALNAEVTFASGTKYSGV